MKDCMNVFFEESGAFKVASIMSEAASSLQVEYITGKRAKIKANNVLMRFESNLSELLATANQLAESFDIDFMWECCGSDEFTFQAFAEEYFGRQPTTVESAAIAIKLHSAPIYFNRKGKGKYKAAPAEILKAALAGLEKKRLVQAKIAACVTALKADTLPDVLREKLDMLLYAPDKNTMEYKALDQASADTHLSHLKLLQQCGAITSIHDYHLGGFLREYFPDGTDFKVQGIPNAVASLPLADVKAFSIDDATTTEIDDAFSILKLDNDITRVGIHIAAPALGIPVDSELDLEIMQRLSTIYMPGNKITMLPEAAIRPFSLDAGEEKPALSLYLHVDAAFKIVQRDTKVERITIADNLRHDALEPYFNEETLTEDTGHPYWSQCLFLFNLAESLEKTRGKYDPSRPPQTDYNFYVTDGIVNIVGRRRGSPMDKLVAELMIETNQQWGGLLATHEVQGLYRAQMGGKVYMTTTAEPHQGLGVDQYAWSTSPLRRAVDLMNQRQIISVVENDAPAYSPNSDVLVGHMRRFEMTHQAYNEFQTKMERYWCLQYLIQEEMQVINATVWRENLVRLDGMHFITKVPSLPTLESGTRITLSINEIDTLLLELTCRFAGKIEDENTETDET